MGENPLIISHPSRNQELLIHDFKQQLGVMFLIRVPAPKKKMSSSQQLRN